MRFYGAARRTVNSYFGLSVRYAVCLGNVTAHFFETDIPAQLPWHQSARWVVRVNASQIRHKIILVIVHGKISRWALRTAPVFCWAPETFLFVWRFTYWKNQDSRTERLSGLGPSLKSAVTHVIPFCHFLVVPPDTAFAPGFRQPLMPQGDSNPVRAVLASACSSQAYFPENRHRLRLLSGLVGQRY